MKRKIMTKTDKNEILEKMIWQFNTNDELMKIIEHHAMKILDLAGDSPRRDSQHQIITEANRIAFLAKNIKLKD